MQYCSKIHCCFICITLIKVLVYQIDKVTLNSSEPIYSGWGSFFKILPAFQFQHDILAIADYSIPANHNNSQAS